MKPKYFVAALGIVGLAALIAMLTLTSPTEIGPFGVLVFFTTLYASLLGLMSAIVSIFFRLTRKRDTLRGKDYLYAAVLAFGPIMLIMARSFGVVTPWTVALILIFLFLAEFLVMKRV